MAIARITRLRIIEGKNNTFERLHRHFDDQVKADEPAALQHILCRSNDDPSEYLLYEQYENVADMIAHGRTAHFNREWTKLALFIVNSPKPKVMDVI